MHLTLTLASPVDRVPPQIPHPSVNELYLVSSQHSIPTVPNPSLPCRPSLILSAISFPTMFFVTDLCSARRSTRYDPRAAIYDHVPIGELTSPCLCLELCQRQNLLPSPANAPVHCTPEPRVSRVLPLPGRFGRVDGRNTSSV